MNHMMVQFDRHRPIVVIGGGTMGSGIGRALAEHGKFPVIIVDINQTILDDSMATIRTGLTKPVVKRSIIPQRADQILGLIQTTTDISVAAEAQFVIEAVTEKIDVKEEVLRKLGEICPADIFVASNTSTLPISKLAEFYGQPEMFVGMHWMNPVDLMGVIELIKAAKTSDEAWNYVKALAIECGKEFAIASDKTGFIANTILFGLLRAAMFAFVNGHGKMGMIEKMMVGLNNPMCPLKLADMIGLDVCRDILLSLHAAHGGNGDDMDTFFAVPKILDDLVDAGYIGPKGEKKIGFYDYTNPKKLAPSEFALSLVA